MEAPIVSMIMTQQIEIVSLRKQLAECKKDAERLDWLIKNETQVFEINSRYHVREVTESHQIAGECMSARDAIDKAMGETKC